VDILLLSTYFPEGLGEREETFIERHKKETYLSVCIKPPTYPCRP